MVLITAATFLLLAGLAAVLGSLARQFASPSCLPATAEWLDELSTARYRPMLRLLGKEDSEFLRTQPGFTSRMATRLRIQRCQIFRGYLRHMDADFQRVCMALKFILVRSNHDRPDLASALLQHQLVFAYRKMTIQFQVVLYRYGVGTVDVTHLVKLFDGMRMELQTLVPAELGAGA